MGFSAPVYLWGLLGALIPVIIHLWRRRRAKRIRFGALVLLLDAHQRTRRKRRLWEILLLALRMLAIASLAVALAGPYKLVEVPSPALGSAPKAIMLVIDDSLSMRRKDKKRALFQQAKHFAEAVLAKLTDLDEVGLIFPCSQKFIAPSKQLGRVKKALSQAKATYQRANLISAIEQAEKSIERKEADKKILVLTDLQFTSFSYQKQLSPFSGEIYFYDLSQKIPEDNLALGRIKISRTHQTSAQLSVKVYNFSSKKRKVHLCLWLGGDVYARGIITLRAYSQGEKNFTISLVKGINAEGKIEIIDSDALYEDNVSYFHLRAGGRVRALIVDGDWSQEPLERESYFLERALNPRLNALSRIDPVVVSESVFTATDLSPYQVLILANCTLLDEKEAEKIKDFVQKGGGLLITVGDKVKADRYNRLLSNLLPRQLRGVKVPFAGAEAKKEIQPMHLDVSFINEPERHAVLKPFISLERGDPSKASFYKYFLFVHELYPKSRVILELTDHTPILVEKNYGKGRVMLFASTVDRDWCDLCIYPSYLPLFHQIVLYLAGALFELNPEQAQVGDQIELALPLEKTSALVRTSQGEEFRLSAEKSGEKNLLKARLLTPGVYYFYYLPSRGPFGKAQADLILSVGIDPKEADLRKISFDELKRLFPAKKIYINSEEQKEKAEVKSVQTKKPYHQIFLLALIIFLLGEILVLVKEAGQ